MPAFAKTCFPSTLPTEATPMYILARGPSNPKPKSKPEIRAVSGVPVHLTYSMERYLTSGTSNTVFDPYIAVEQQVYRTGSREKDLREYIRNLELITYSSEEYLEDSTRSPAEPYEAHYLTEIEDFGKYRSDEFVLPSPTFYNKQK